jgi:EmrB/QacA subfamily drug resistance transporter
MSDHTTDAPGAPADDRLDRGTVLALLAMALGVFVIANDFTALSVAIPRIEGAFDTTLTTSQWVINGYALVFGVLIVTGGRLADMFGRKRLFMIGAAFFAGFSLLGGLAPNVELLIACRALMGIGGALMWPAILGMTYAILPDAKAGLAGGLILGVAGIGNAVGPMLGGVLTDELSWRWVFFLNVPVTLFAIVVTARQVPETQVGGTERSIDWAGIVTLTTGAVAILVALDEGPSVGFGEPQILGLFALGALGLGAFAWVEARRRDDGGLVPRDVLRSRTFTAAAITVLFMSAIFFSALVYLPQFMSKELGFSAVESGAGLLPLMAVFAVTSFVAGGLYDRLGSRTTVCAGALFLGLGILVLSFLDADSSYWSLVPGMVIMGVGVGLFYSAITTTAVTALDPSRSSLAGGIVYMCQIAGGAVGLGLNTAIIASASSLPAGISAAFTVDAVLAGFGFVVSFVYCGTPAEHAEHRRRLLRHLHRAHV